MSGLQFVEQHLELGGVVRAGAGQLGHVDQRGAGCLQHRRARSRSTAETRSLRPPNSLRTTPRRLPCEAARIEEARVVVRVPGRRPRSPASRSSLPASTVSSSAASATVRVIGPAVSFDWAIGMMPPRLTSPTVGLMPTRPLIDDGEMIEPSVSVPTASGREAGGDRRRRSRSSSRWCCGRARTGCSSARRARSSRWSSASSGCSPTRRGWSCRGSPRPPRAAARR